MPFNNNITSLNFSYDDRLNRDPLTTFSSKFNTTTNVNTEFDCISIFGPVNNINCPDEYPDCNCPVAFVDLRPKFSEPSITEIENARHAAEECMLIKKTFGICGGFPALEYLNWGGIDYSNKYSTYNCFGSEKYGKFKWSDTPDTSNDKLGPFQKLKAIKGVSGATLGASSSGLFPYSIRVSFPTGVSLDGSSAGYASWQGITANSIIDILDTESKTDANKTVYPSLFGVNFPYYLEYSKTSATFWNTPPHTPLYRKAQTGLLKYQKIKILVNGNFKIKPGNLIYISLPSTNTDASAPQSKYQGIWMVYRAERIIKPGKHSMYLYLMRDYPSIDPDLVLGPVQINKSHTVDRPKEE